MTTERLPRPQRRALEREDAAFLARPLTRGDDLRALEAHVRRMVKLLRDPAAASPSADAVAHIGGLFDRSLPEAARTAVACRRGCAHCCHQRVAATAVEAFALAHAIRGRPALSDRVIAADARTRALDRDQRRGAACPLLADAACAAYPARPLVCRGAASLDVNGCIAAFIHRQDDAAFRAPVDYTTIATKCKVALCAALKILGRPYAFYEMNAAVAIALGEGSEARWLAGEDMFAPASMSYVTPDSIAARIDAMAAAIGATV